MCARVWNGAISKRGMGINSRRPRSPQLPIANRFNTTTARSIRSPSTGTHIIGNKSSVSARSERPPAIILKMVLCFILGISAEKIY